MALLSRREQAIEAFEKLRQCFDVIKTNHVDPWSWHEYLSQEAQQEPSSDDDADDPELMTFKPAARQNVDRLKTHLLACVAELNRAAQAADLCYFHMCCTPEELRSCVMVLGTAGDIDADLLESAGDASPGKVLEALQKRLDEVREQMAQLQAEGDNLKALLADAQATTQERILGYELAAMAAEEAVTRANGLKHQLDESVERESVLQAALDDIYCRYLRASRLMLYKARQMLRDTIFKVNKKEMLFNSFQGFTYVLQKEKEERIRREQEEQRNAVMFALRNEVQFLQAEASRRAAAVERLTVEAGRLKRDRRELACRILHKHRPHEPLEYCLWLWELWQPVRKQLVLEKFLETEQAARAAVGQQLAHTSSLLPSMAARIDRLRLDLAGEKLAHDISRKELVAAGARRVAAIVEQLRAHRSEELAVLGRLHRIDTEAKEERIAVLEKELAEDTHIKALKGMVLELETNLRKALDRRKQRPFVVPPAGQKCVQCQRDLLFRNWRCTPMQGMMHSASDVDLSQSSTGAPGAGLAKLASLASAASLASTQSAALPAEAGGKPWPEKKATYLAVWR